MDMLSARPDMRIKLEHVRKEQFGGHGLRFALRNERVRALLRKEGHDALSLHGCHTCSIALEPACLRLCSDVAVFRLCFDFTGIQQELDEVHPLVTHEDLVLPFQLPHMALCQAHT